MDYGESTIHDCRQCRSEPVTARWFEIEATGKGFRSSPRVGLLHPCFFLGCVYKAGFIFTTLRAMAFY